MSKIERYDNWVLGEVKAILEWLNEWLSLSQKTVERALIGFYAVGSVLMIESEIQYGLRTIGFTMFSGLLQLAMVTVLCIWHRDAPSVRQAKHKNSTGTLYRTMWQFVGVTSFLPPYRPTVAYVAIAVVNFSFLSFIYVIACETSGQRGRKRKLALSKLKELFSWLPAPQPEGI